MCTRINNTFSEYFEQTSGIAQETVLGTLYFMLYISDLPDLIKNCDIKLHADDVKLYFRFSPNKWCDMCYCKICMLSKIGQLSIAMNSLMVLHIR